MSAKKTRATSAQQQSAVKNPTKATVSRLQKLQKSRAIFLARRPHRSFRLTNRRDYKRSLSLPGYISFTSQVSRELWTVKRQMLLMVAVYSIMTSLFATIVSQDTYRQVYSSVNSSLEGIANGTFSEVIKAGALLAGAAGGSLSGTSTEIQQAYAVGIGLFTWLTTVWLLRAKFAGSIVGLRDALYNAGAPVIATVVVGVLVLLQLVPGAIGIVGYQTLVQSGLASAGILAMLVTIIAALLIVLSVYWLSSSLFAFVIVTLPGMYPMQAIRTAGDIVIGRRLRVLLRITWLIACVLVAWAIIMIPFVIGINALQDHINWLATIPIIPVAIILMTAASTIFASAYMYILYRRIVDDTAAPA